MFQVKSNFGYMYSYIIHNKEHKIQTQLTQFQELCSIIDIHDFNDLNRLSKNINYIVVQLPYHYIKKISCPIFCTFCTENKTGWIYNNSYYDNTKATKAIYDPHRLIQHTGSFCKDCFNEYQKFLLIEIIKKPGN